MKKISICIGWYSFLNLFAYTLVSFLTGNFDSYNWGIGVKVIFIIISILILLPISIVPALTISDE